MSADARSAARALTPRERQLVVDNQGFARNLIHYYKRAYAKRLGVDELGQIVQLALVEAAPLFDPERDTKFGSFVWHRLRGALARAAGRRADALDGAVGRCLDLEDADVELDADEGRLRQRSAGMANRAAAAVVVALLGAAVAEPPPPASTPETAALGDELGGVIAKSIGALSERQRHLIAACYGEDRTIRDAAAELGVPYITARREHDRALDAIRAACEAAGFGHQADPRR